MNSSQRVTFNLGFNLKTVKALGVAIIPEIVMAAITPKADIKQQFLRVRFGP
jgi:hypothetical protein